MDKKQALTPELKAIYERVMNTPTASNMSAAGPHSVSPAAPAPQIHQTAPVTPQPSTISSAASSAKPAGNQFVFSTTASHAAAPAGAGAVPPVTATVLQPRRGGSFKLLVFAGIVFFIFYLIFWLKFFKYL